MKRTGQSRNIEQSLRLNHTTRGLPACSMIVPRSERVGFSWERYSCMSWS